MTENTTQIKKVVLTSEICHRIRNETIKPWSWFFAAANPCVSCVLLSGGHPEIMSCGCPRVNAILAEELEQEEAETEEATPVGV